MKGLIYKDLVTITKQMKIFIIICAFYMVMTIVGGNPAFFGGVVSVMSATLPLTAFSYDERSKWDKIAMSMPVSRNTIILSKYVLGIAFSLFAAFINIIVMFLFKQNSSEAAYITLGFIAVSLLFVSIMYPIVIKIGVEKAKIITIAIYLAPTAVVLVLSKLGFNFDLDFDFRILPYIIPFILVVALRFSIMISLKIYKNKEIA